MPAWQVTIKVIDWNEAAADLANYSDEDLANLGDTGSTPVPPGNTPDPTVNLEGVNLLDFVAEYNIDITGTKFTTSHTNEAGYTGYFTWEEAMALALTMPAGYYLPTGYEWRAILGAEWGGHHYIYFNQNKTEKDVALAVQIPGQTETMDCVQDYKQVSAESATYMIRYKDNDTYRSAWRYSWVDGPITGQKVLKIEAVPVKTDLTIEQLNKEYFANPKVRKYVKTIYLPATGYDYNKDGSGSGSQRGSDGDYWSSKEDIRNVYYGNFNSTGALVNLGDCETNRFAVRPFRNL